LSRTTKTEETEETKTHRRLTIEEVMAKLGELYGSDAQKVIKMFSELDEYDIQSMIFYLDVLNTYPTYTFLETPVYEVLRLRVSLNRGGRIGLETILKTPFTQPEGSLSEKSRLQRLRDLFT